MASIKAQFRMLGPEEQIDMVMDLWDEIATREERAPISEALKVELSRRLANYRANPEAAIPWETVKAERLRSR
jgi:putative addiction module component (TIGR02574 family)